MAHEPLRNLRSRKSRRRNLNSLGPIRHEALVHGNGAGGGA